MHRKSRVFYMFQASDVVASSYTLSVESFPQISVIPLYPQIINKTFSLQLAMFFRCFLCVFCGVFLLLFLFSYISPHFLDISSSPQIVFCAILQSLYLADLY